ncbi:MAG: alkaline phosphatase family protein [Dermatophilaceae bacterium]|nr:alkaline phosphatase family protein [Dermatophilaceae bacterium]MBP9917628.1 alkaline phosphatase family protein [Dermatophilaceae bacterium]
MGVPPAWGEPPVGNAPSARTRHTLADVLPSVLAALGGDIADQAPAIELTPARRAIVVLIDGLGDQLLRRRAGHAPFLRSSLPSAQTITCGFPSTTATSMGTFGTGLLPGAHGMVGYEMLDPDRDVVFNGLSWEGGPEPRRWQPNHTVFERAEASGISVTRIGPGFFDGSGLTIAALRGGSFRAASGLAAGVDAALAASRATPRSLVYLYWGDLDKTGHVHGAASWQWGDELESIDAQIARLVAGVAEDTAVILTADHGMVDVPLTQRIDLALEPELLDGVRHTSGEPRALALHCAPGAATDVMQRWQERLGDRGVVESRATTMAAGRFGPVSDWVAPRIGDLLVLCDPGLAVVNSAVMRPVVLALLGLHGGVTADEVLVPMFHWPARLA